MNYTTPTIEVFEREEVVKKNTGVIVKPEKLQKSQGK